VVSDVDKIMTLSSWPDVALVTPGALADFIVRFENKVSDDYVLQAVTKTLPVGFRFIEVATGPEPEREGQRLVWRDVVVPGNSKVMWRIRTQASVLFGSYTSRLEAYTRELPRLATDSDAITVLPLVQVTKDCLPCVVRPGATLAYTISLLNLQSRTFTGIRITDSLPAGFTFSRMLDGPEPVSTGPNDRQPVWGNLAVQRNGAIRTIVMEVQIADDAPQGVYYNIVTGSAPEALVPGTDQTAPVTVTLGGVLPTPPPTRTGTPEPSPSPGGPTWTPTPTRTPFTRVAWLYLPAAYKGW
jgi:uncharacterized repeat protein (TIGR01451 family)